MSRFIQHRSCLVVAAPLLVLSRPLPRAGDDDDDKSKDVDKERRNLENLLAKHKGDAVALAAQLLAENANLREDRRQRDATITDLRAKVPGEGAVVLTGDEAKAHTAITQLGTPEDLKKLQGERDDLQAKYEAEQQKNLGTQREILLRDVADNVAPGQKYRLSVLKAQDERTPGLSYELKEVQEEVEENGQKVEKKVQKAFVKFKDGEGESAPLKEMALTDFAEQKWNDFLPALLVPSENSGGGSTSNGARHVAQGGGGSGKNTSFDAADLDNFSQNRYGHNLPQSTSKS